MSCYDANSYMCEKCRREIFGTVAFLPSEEEGSAPGRNWAPAKEPLSPTQAAGFFRFFPKFGPRTGLFPEILPIRISEGPLYLYIPVLRILFLFKLWACEPAWLLDHSQLV